MRRNRRILIRENSKRLLNEGFVDREYHFTSLSNAYEILTSNTIRLQSTFAKDAESNGGKDKFFYMSLTRQKNANFGYSRKFMTRGARIEFDGRLLSQNHSSSHEQYWSGDVFQNKYKYYKDIENQVNKGYSIENDPYYISEFKEKHPEATEKDIHDYFVKNFNPDAQAHIDNESEDRLFSSKPSIENVSKYIISVDIMIPDIEKNEDNMKLAIAFYNIVEFRDKIRIYSDEKAFAIGDERKTMNNVVEEAMKADSYRLYNDSKNTKFSPDIRPGTEANYVITTILFISLGDEEFSNNFGAAAKRYLDKYGLSKFSIYIGQMIEKANRYGSFLYTTEHMESIMRNLSDEPTEVSGKLLSMLHDYAYNHGVSSFSELKKLKKRMSQQECYRIWGQTSELIDTLKKLPMLVCKNSYTVSIDPDRELFKDLAGKSEKDLSYCAEAIASDKAYEGNLMKSKNLNSLFFYLRKLFIKGTVRQVYDFFQKNQNFISPEELEPFYIDITQEDLDYYDARKYETINSRKYYDRNYDKSKDIKNKEIIKYFLEHGAERPA